MDNEEEKKEQEDNEEQKEEQEAFEAQEIVEGFYPSNSNAVKDKEISSPKMKKVITGKIVKRKKSWIESFSDTVFGESSKNATEYVIYDVLIPAAKNLILDMIIGGLEMRFFPNERRNSSIRRDRDMPRVSYTGYYKDRDRDHGERNRRINRQESSRRPVRQFEVVALDRRDDAENVLTSLVEEIDKYGIASVADYRELIGIESEYTDNHYGWDEYDLRGVTSRRVREGWIINLPTPHLID